MNDEKRVKQVDKMLETDDGKIIPLRTKHSPKGKKKDKNSDISYVLF